MEKFDIEKLKRNTPYKLPENTFEDVQRKVLAETVRSKQAPIFNLKWVYSAAAVILLLIGFGFFINSNQPQQNTNSEVLAKNTQSLVNVNEADGLKNIDENKSDGNLKDENNSVENLAVADLTSQPVRNQTVRQTNFSAADQKSETPKMISVSMENKVDNVLDGFSAKEIASLTANTEQDVYLDLYNQL